MPNSYNHKILSKTTQNSEVTYFEGGILKTRNFTNKNRNLLLNAQFQTKTTFKRAFMIFKKQIPSLVLDIKHTKFRLLTAKHLDFKAKFRN